MERTDAYFYFRKIAAISDDGFIVVNREGYVIEINDNYCKFLNKKRNDVLGKSIFEIIPNSKMLKIMEERLTEEVSVHHYLTDTKEKTVLVSRSYVENEFGEVIGGVAQVKFRLQSLDVTKRLMKEYDMFQFYKFEYENSKENKNGFNSLIGNSYEFTEKKKQGLKAAKTNFSVLITGETGTGKEVFAKAIHNNSMRSHKPMICVNCAAIPKELIESEFFGYVEGAFTGAKKGGKRGKFEIANGGTIFLDEVADMDIGIQSKLLRVLQEKEIEPVGSNQTISVDVRIIAATRKNINEMILEGSFREDLYYRLNVINIEMIPLRDRRDDILELSDYFLNKLNKEYKTNKKLDKKVKKYFLDYNWPGNIRQLDNVIKSAYAASEGEHILEENLPRKIANEVGADCLCSSLEKDLHLLVNEYEKRVIVDALQRHNWNCQAAAKDMNIHRSLLYKKMHKHNISRP